MNTRTIDSIIPKKEIERYQRLKCLIDELEELEKKFNKEGVTIEFLDLKGFVREIE